MKKKKENLTELESLIKENLTELESLRKENLTELESLRKENLTELELLNIELNELSAELAACKKELEDSKLALSESVAEAASSDEQAIRDRQIARQMEGAMRSTNEMVVQMGKTYEGLYDVVKDSLASGSHATKALSILAVSLEESGRQDRERCRECREKCCKQSYSCTESSLPKCSTGGSADCEKPCEKSCESPHQGCCKKTEECTGGQTIHVDKPNLLVELSNDPKDFDQDEVEERIDNGFKELE